MLDSAPAFDGYGDAGGSVKSDTNEIHWPVDVTQDWCIVYGTFSGGADSGGVITEFRTRRDAERFAETYLVAHGYDYVLKCAQWPAEQENNDLPKEPDE